MNNKNDSYRFMSEEEPSDSELKMIMHEVAVEAKEKALKTQKDLKLLTKNLVAKLLAERKLKNNEA